jgi:hypothetical protein
MKPVVRYTNNPTYRPYATPKGVKIALGRALNSAIAEALSKTGGVISGEEIKDIKSKLYANIDEGATSFNKEFSVESYKIVIKFKSFGLDARGDYRHYDIFIDIYSLEDDILKEEIEKALSKKGVKEVNVINDNKVKLTIELEDWNAKKSMVSSLALAVYKAKRMTEKQKNLFLKDILNRALKQEVAVTDSETVIASHISDGSELAFTFTRKSNGLYDVIVNIDIVNIEDCDSADMELFVSTTSIEDGEDIRENLKIALDNIKRQKRKSGVSNGIWDDTIDTFGFMVGDGYIWHILYNWYRGIYCTNRSLFYYSDWHIKVCVEPIGDPQSNSRSHEIRVLLIKKGA